MRHSEAYEDFFVMLNPGCPSGLRKDGFNPDTLKSVYDWELKEIEDAIWDSFVIQFRAYDLCIFMPYLKEYDGLSELKRILFADTSSVRGSKYSVTHKIKYAVILYKYSSDPIYIDVILECLNVIDSYKITDYSKYNSCLLSKQAAFVEMGNMKPCQKIYDFFVKNYIENTGEVSTEKVIHFISKENVFRYNGICLSPCPNESDAVWQFMRGLNPQSENRVGRLGVLRNLESGEFNNYVNCDRVVDDMGKPFRSKYSESDYNEEYKPNESFDNKYIFVSDDGDGKKNILARLIGNLFG